MAGYNLTGIISNSTSVLKFTQGVNDSLMGGWLGTFFLISISIVLFMSFVYTTQDAAKSLSATAFLSFLIAIFLRAVGLIMNDIVLFITIILAAATIAFNWRR